MRVSNEVKHRTYSPPLGLLPFPEPPEPGALGDRDNLCAVVPIWPQPTKVLRPLGHLSPSPPLCLAQGRALAMGASPP